MRRRPRSDPWPRAAALLVAAAMAAGCGQRVGPVMVFPAESPPAQLSAWGIVAASGGELRVNDEVRPYAINTPLFSDYALKLRTVWVPDRTVVGWRDEGPLDFPVGTVFSKTFYYREPATGSARGAAPPLVDRHAAAPGDDAPRGIDLAGVRIVETRLLVRYAAGWKAFAYVWDAAERDAALAPAGDLLELAFADTPDVPFTYVVPDTNQCAGCHVTDHGLKVLQPIGPEAWQLNRPLGTGAAAVNQLDAWQAAGLLSGAPAHYPAGIDWADAATPVADRARAYLDSNCAHCHNDRGAADTSALDLRYELEPGRASGICKPPVAVGRGSGDRPYDIVPGRPDDSILLYRMQHSDPAIAMPELGRSTVHEEAVELVAAWIRGMDGAC